MSTELLHAVLHTASVLPLIPLVAAAGIAVQQLGSQPATSLAEADHREPAAARIALGATALVLILILLIDAAAIGSLIFGYHLPSSILLGTFFSSGDHVIPYVLTFDSLSLPVGTIVAFVALITLRFSRQYLHREAGFQRFFMVVCIFLSGMLFVVFSGNAVLAFIGWELAGVSSYLLIGFAYERHTATRNAQFAFVTNRIGDAGFMVAIAISLIYIGGVGWHEIGQHHEALISRLAALGFVTAALVKSAQWPFGAWIGRALEGPTPSSAIFYGAVMVHAGIFLLIRLEPLLLQVPDLMILLIFIGLVTAVLSWLTALTQTDIKSALLFATLSQTGLMLAACGFGFFRLALAHLCAHMLWRAYQFLRAPAILALSGRPAPPPAAWLSSRAWLHTAALQRFWIDSLSQIAVMRPFSQLARDARSLEERFIASISGAPQAPALIPSPAPLDPLIQSPGTVGRLLYALSNHLLALESRLALQGGDTQARRIFLLAGDYFRQAENLIEHPRYLIILVMLTFVVIL